MMHQLVICFHWHERGSAAQDFLAASAWVQGELQSLSGQWIAWSGDHYALAFAPARLPDLLPAVRHVLQHVSALSAGLCQDELVVGVAGRCWGRALLAAEDLARAARRGEALLDLPLAEHWQGLIGPTAAVRIDLGHQTLQAASLWALPNSPEPLRHPEHSALSAHYEPSLDSGPAHEAMPELISSAVDSQVPTPRTPHDSSTAEDRPDLEGSSALLHADSSAAQPRSRRRASWPSAEPVPDLPAAVGAQARQSVPPAKPSVRRSSPPLDPDAAGAELARAEESSNLRSVADWLRTPAGDQPALVLDTSGISAPRGAFDAALPSELSTFPSDAQAASVELASSDLVSSDLASSDVASSDWTTVSWTGSADLPAAESQTPLVGMPALRVSSVPPPKPSVRPRSARAMLSDPPPKPSRNSLPYSPQVSSQQLDAGPVELAPLEAGPLEAENPTTAAPDEDAAETLRVDHLRQLNAVRASNAESADSPSTTEQPRPDAVDEDANWGPGQSDDAGDIELGLLRLREVVRSAVAADASNLPQARLALAVGLRRQGALREAYLEGLLALAAARLRADDAAVRATARLLAALTRSAGFEVPAVSWDELAARHDVAVGGAANES
jgi:hypothetical protein